MSRASEAVRDFHEFFGLPVRAVPTNLGEQELSLRKSLLEEEHAELQEALDTGDLKQIAKEAADLLYVLYGLQWHVGLDFDRAFAAVHRSNMTKLWNIDCEHCNSTGREPLSGKSYYCQVCHGAQKGRYSTDGKVLKGPNYRPPDLNYIDEEL